MGHFETKISGVVGGNVSQILTQSGTEIYLCRLIRWSQEWKMMINVKCKVINV